MSNGRVFVTTAVETRTGLANLFSVRAREILMGSIVLVLTVLAVGLSVETVFRDPTNPTLWLPSDVIHEEYRPRKRRAFASIVMTCLFVLAVYGFVALCAWLSTAYPWLPILRNPVRWRPTVPPFAGLSNLQIVWGSGGALAAVLVWAFNALVPCARERCNDRSRNGMLPLLKRINGFLIVLATGAFLGLQFLIVSLVAPAHQQGGFAFGLWGRTAVTGVTGVLAVVGLLASIRRNATVRCELALFFIILLICGPPEAQFDWLYRWAAEFYLAYFTLVLAAVVWLTASFHWLSRHPMPSTVTSPRRCPALPPIIAMLLVGQLSWTASEAWDRMPTYQRRLVALDRNTGQILWDALCRTQKLDTGHAENSGATPTPVTDGGLVFANFGDAGTCAFDFDGRIVWQDGEAVPEMRWGYASSPVLWEDFLIVAIDTDIRSFMRAFDKRTGEVRWEIDRHHEYLPSQAGYATPIVVDRPEGAQIIHYGSRHLDSRDPGTGAVIWSIAANDRSGRLFLDMLYRDKAVPSPLVVDDILILAGTCTRPSHLTALELNGISEKSPPELLWESRQNPPGCSSPVVSGDHIYAVTNNGVISRRELRSGRLVERRRLTPGKYYASVTAASGHLYVANVAGAVSVVAASDGMALEAVNELHEEVNASPAIGSREIFIRTREHLWCIGSPDAAPHR